ncbi:hypothetical protein [Polaribacter sp. M15]
MFALIFVIGIYLTIRTVHVSLNKTETPQETVEIQKDSIKLLQTKKKIKTV